MLLLVLAYKQKIGRYFIFCFHLEKKNHIILTALQYKSLYNSSCSEKWGKRIQAAAYYGAHIWYILKALVTGE